jgi:protein XagA
MTRKISTQLAVTASLIALSATLSHAGAWTMPQGKLYDRVAANYYFADDNFGKNSKRSDFAANGKFSDLNLSNYIEYGVTDRLTAINSLAYKRIEKEDDLQERTTYGVGDIDLAARYKIHEGAAGVWSAQGTVKIPEAYDRHKALPLGNGQYDLELKALYGRSLWPYIHGYCGAEIGYRWRLDDPSDELRYLVEFGMDFSKDFYGRVKLDGITSINNGRKTDTSGNPTTTNNFDLGKLDIALGYKFTPALGIELGYAPALYGQNTAAGATYTVAMTYQTR